MAVIGFCYVVVSCFSAICIGSASTRFLILRLGEGGDQLRPEILSHDPVANIEAFEVCFFRAYFVQDTAAGQCLNSCSVLNLSLVHAILGSQIKQLDLLNSRSEHLGRGKDFFFHPVKRSVSTSPTVKDSKKCRLP